MKIFKDFLTGDEIFSDVFEKMIVDEIMYEVYGKLIERKQTPVVIEGFNPSAKKLAAELNESVKFGVDIVLNHRLVESYIFVDDRKSFSDYLKNYMRKLITHLKETQPDQVEVFKSNVVKVTRDMLGRFKQLQFFTGASMNTEGMIAMMEYREINNDIIPVLMCFKHGLQEEKV